MRVIICLLIVLYGCFSPPSNIQQILIEYEKLADYEIILGYKGSGCQKCVSDNFMRFIVQDWHAQNTESNYCIFTNSRLVFKELKELNYDVVLDKKDVLDRLVNLQNGTVFQIENSYLNRKYTELRQLPVSALE